MNANNITRSNNFVLINTETEGKKVEIEILTTVTELYIHIMN